MNKTPSTLHKTVCVVSAPQLENQLIARRLEERNDVDCLTAESLDKARSSLGRKYERITLFLLGCRNKDLSRSLRRSPKSRRARTSP